MPRTERTYSLISTSYLVGLFGISYYFILTELWFLGVVLVVRRIWSYSDVNLRLISYKLLLLLCRKLSVCTVKKCNTGRIIIIVIIIIIIIIIILSLSLLLLLELCLFWWRFTNELISVQFGTYLERWFLFLSGLNEFAMQTANLSLTLPTSSTKPKSYNSNSPNRSPHISFSVSFKNLEVDKDDIPRLNSL